MIDTAQARRTMVDSQIRASDVTDARVLEAFLETPREAFLPADKQAIAYLDMDIPVGGAPLPRFAIEPAVLARLLQAARIGSADAVLDVGTGTGYSSAILARIAGRVVALESDAALAAEAKGRLAGLANVTVAIGPLEAGHAKDGPYDAIVLEGSVELVPDALFDQLAQNGRLVAVVGTGRSARATIYVKAGREVSGREAFDAALPPLPGFARPEVFAF
ncbi:protein-L-isoaspartate O-methyltransferase family protein [Labrys wisconsinensis]|uniref:Protein-L-isoaspartate O-methyltransferase n=1 Tax=Labrys wisconsinensis TaxID=425677 RepID=A0ABU0J5B5_9HYPH|nr:protein-L-isoaspartate O-methyltransferase [Labrys wisconsinensis]MDQ0468825.1 protein-L-isoaspartate(D-aspartate) O-methyltransferase [Labrys wisconsinensis]